MVSINHERAYFKICHADIGEFREPPPPVSRCAWIRLSELVDGYSPSSVPLAVVVVVVVVEEEEAV